MLEFIKINGVETRLWRLPKIVRLNYIWMGLAMWGEPMKSAVSKSNLQNSSLVLKGLQLG